MSPRSTPRSVRCYATGCARATSPAHPVAVLSEVVVGTFNTLMLNWLGIDDYPFRARATAMARFLADALRVRKGSVAAAKVKNRRE
jgi:hypothetical protein